jgi:hypothetical protein
MLSRNFAVLTCTILVLVGESQLSAHEEKEAAPQARCKCLDALASKLGLSRQQTAEIRKIQAEFAQKASAPKQQLKSIHHNKRQAISTLLTQEQKTKVKEIIKAERETRWQAAAAKLNLGDEQKHRVEVIRQEHTRTLEDLAKQPGENKHDQFRALRHQEYQAIGRELTKEQRARLHQIVRKEHRQRRDRAVRAAFWNSVREKLDLSPEQREQIQKIHAAFAAKAEKPAAQLKALSQERNDAVVKVLTDEQLAKLREWHQLGCGR